MKIAIIGSRHLVASPLVVGDALSAAGWFASTIGSGGCRGADSLAAAWSRSFGVPFVAFPAAWSLFGRSAGPRRSFALVRWASAVLVLARAGRPLGRGSEAAVRAARVAGRPVFVFPVGSAPPASASLF
jgi:hypothetical protein